MEHTAVSKAVSPNYFEKTVQIKSDQVGAGGIIHLSALLRLAQETSEAHMDAIGLDYEKMAHDGIVMLITENRVQVRRFPVRKESVRIVTRPCGGAGVQFYRDFIFYSGEQELLRIRQVSVCVSLETHRPLRPDALYHYQVFRQETVPKEMRVNRLRIKFEQPPLGERPIRYSDLDQNRHLTNTIYGDIVEDFLPEEYRAWKTVQISYLSECRLGDVLVVRGGVRENQFIMTGVHPNGISFAAAIEK